MKYCRGQILTLHYSEKIIECLLDEPLVGGMITSPKPRSRVAFEYAHCEGVKSLFLILLQTPPLSWDQSGKGQRLFIYGFERAWGLKGERDRDG